MLVSSSPLAVIIAPINIPRRMAFIDFPRSALRFRGSIRATIRAAGSGVLHDLHGLGRPFRILNHRVIGHNVFLSELFSQRAIVIIPIKGVTVVGLVA